MRYVIPTTTDHIPLIRKMAMRIWPAAYRGVLEDKHITNLLANIYSEENLAEEMHHGHQFWIIYEENVPSGYISAYKQDEAIWIRKLYVDLGHQRSGLGTALMDYAIKELRPANEVKLLVNRNNKAAIEYYKHKGFLQSGETHVKMGDFEFNDYIFSRPLPPV